MTEPLSPPGAARRRRILGLPPPETPGDRIKMAVGVLGGIAVSLVAWGMFLDRMTPTWMTVVIGGKLILGLVFVALPGWRPLGQGLLASIAIGAMIFVWKFCSGIGG